MKLAYIIRLFSRKEFVWEFALAGAILSGCGGGAGSDKTAISVATPFDDPVRARQVASIYAAAKLRDTTAMLALKKEPSSAPDPAVALALYVLNPASSADFVAAYPTDERGIMLDYGSRLEAAKLVPTGRRFPIDALGALAVKGDPIAFNKLFSAFAQARQPIAADYARTIAHVAKLRPRETLAVIAELPATQQLDLTTLSAWCGRVQPPLLSAPAVGDAQSAVQNQIRAHRAGNCPAPPIRKKHRQPHPRHKPARKHAKPAPKNTSKPKHP
jgi:hypothetical protein